MISLFGPVSYDEDDLPTLKEAYRLGMLKVFQIFFKTIFALLAWLIIGVVLNIPNLPFHLVLLVISVIYAYHQVRMVFWAWELDNKIKAEEEP